MVSGSCLCGSIKYEVEIVPEQIFNCHCQFCRKAHGADYATVAVANASTLKVTDEKGVLKEHKNDIGGFRAFCSECGSRLMNYAEDKNMWLCITLATVDTPISYKPVAHANLESKASWCEPYEGIPQFSGLPEGI
ncbi:Glutathione-dependent formaldehyde-activating enzyme [Halioglobus japonicus]|nr:Glutathione-dependent formaldehyde-activating enzyme [Halioglobus japonicus]